MVETNPYAPPKSSDTDSVAAQPLTPQREGEAIVALGKLRARAAARAFAVGWLVATLLLLLVTGFVPALLVGSAIAGGISKFYVKSRKQAMVDAVCRQLGMAPGGFSPDKYLID